MAGRFQPQPVDGTKAVTEQGHLTIEYRKFLDKIPEALSSPAKSGSVPATTDAQGIPGQLANDGTFLYVCVAPSLWRRVLLSAW